MSAANDIDLKLLLSKAYDAFNLSVKRNSPCFLGFLNEHEAQYVKDHAYLNNECMFWGGFDDAQRVILGCKVSLESDFPIVALRFVYKKEYQLSHRDFLGALMSLGIERSTVGDILVFEGEAIVFVKSEIADYILGQICKIGKIGVNVALFDANGFTYHSDFETLNFTLSSLRLDVFVSAVCSLSRDKSQRLIISDAVSINHRNVNNVSKTIEVSDVIVIKKYGKFVFTKENGFSKKGKVKISVKHFR